MLGEVTHLQAISDDLIALTSDPHKLPPASEQVRKISGMKTSVNKEVKQVVSVFLSQYDWLWFFYLKGYISQNNYSLVKFLPATVLQKRLKWRVLSFLSGDHGTEGLRLQLVISNSTFFPQHHHVQEVKHVQVDFLWHFTNGSKVKDSLWLKSTHLTTVSMKPCFI